MTSFLIGVEKGQPLLQFPEARFHGRSSGLWLYIVESARSEEELRATPGLVHVEVIC